MQMVDNTIITLDSHYVVNSQFYLSFLVLVLQRIISVLHSCQSISSKRFRFRNWDYL